MKQDGLIKQFWRWLGENEMALYEAGDKQTDLMIEMIVRLKKIDPMLLVDFGLETNGKRELVITAQGDKSRFPVVMRVVDGVPILKRWRVQAFRGRRPIHMTIRYQGTKVKTSEAFFSYSLTNNKMKVRVYFLDWLELKGHERQLAMTMVENLLGEHDAATYVLVEVGGKVEQAGEDEELLPLVSLPAVFDEKVGKN